MAEIRHASRSRAVRAQAKIVATNVFSCPGVGDSGRDVRDPDRHHHAERPGARSATVSFTASSTNFFPSILGQTSWALSGSAAAGSTQAPNIDFYMMPDNSPSMAITAGINKIAILYTEYDPLGSDSFYQQYVAPFQSSIGSNLQSCASSGLYFGITTDQDITSALTTLFNTAVQSVEAHLSN